jgi:hypothetical protein
MYLRRDFRRGASEPAAPLQDGTISPPELTATNSTLWGIISLAPFCTTKRSEDYGKAKELQYSLKALHYILNRVRLKQIMH